MPLTDAEFDNLMAYMASENNKIRSSQMSEKPPFSTSAASCLRGQSSSNVLSQHQSSPPNNILDYRIQSQRKSASPTMMRRKEKCAVEPLHRVSDGGLPNRKLSKPYRSKEGSPRVSVDYKSQLDEVYSSLEMNSLSVAQMPSMPLQKSGKVRTGSLEVNPSQIPLEHSLALYQRQMSGSASQAAVTNQQNMALSYAKFSDIQYESEGYPISEPSTLSNTPSSWAPTPEDVLREEAIPLTETQISLDESIAILERQLSSMTGTSPQH